MVRRSTAGAQQPHLEECKTDSSKTERTDKLDSAGSESAKSSGLPAQRAQQHGHLRSGSGSSNPGGGMSEPVPKIMERLTCIVQHVAQVLTVLELYTVHTPLGIVQGEGWRVQKSPL